MARASLQKLLLDYEDYLRVRGLTLWPVSSEKSIRCRRVCASRNDSEYYRDAIQTRSDETIANIAITLIHQTDVLLRKLIDRLQADFLKNGGIKEQRYRTRIDTRNSKED